MLCDAKLRQCTYLSAIILASQSVRSNKSQSAGLRHAIYISKFSLNVRDADSHCNLTFTGNCLTAKSLLYSLQHHNRSVDWKEMKKGDLNFFLRGALAVGALLLIQIVLCRRR